MNTGKGENVLEVIVGQEGDCTLCNGPYQWTCYSL